MPSEPGGLLHSDSFGNGTGLGSASRAGSSSAAAGRENGTIAIVLMLFIALGISLFCFCIRGGHFFESAEERSTRDACAGCLSCCDLCANNILPLLAEIPRDRS
uniref:4Fe-4S ferredoxin-type domain-containing protein n=1 Tax=Globodera rostochiensis TaxID=31243 RepID=A0A914HNQ1_GLORO